MDGLAKYLFCIEVAGGSEAFHAGEYTANEAEQLLEAVQVKYEQPEPWAINLTESGHPQVDVAGALAEWDITERHLEYLEANQRQLAEALTADIRDPIQKAIYGNTPLVYPRWHWAKAVGARIVSGRPKDSAPPGTPPGGKGVEDVTVRTKKSTAKGDARVKIIAALTKHHKYQDDSCLNQDPIGVSELARQADVGKTSASRFFTEKFEGWTRYRTACRDVSSLVAALKLLNQDFSPHHLFGRTPPGEGKIEE